MPCGWEGNRRSGVWRRTGYALNRLEWFIHLPAHGLRKWDKRPAYVTLFMGYGTLYLNLVGRVQRESTNWHTNHLQRIHNIFTRQKLEQTFSHFPSLLRMTYQWHLVWFGRNASFYISPEKNRDISARVRPISMKFGRMMQKGFIRARQIKV